MNAILMMAPFLHENVQVFLRPFWTLWVCLKKKGKNDYLGLGVVLDLALVGYNLIRDILLDIINEFFTPQWHSMWNYLQFKDKEYIYFNFSWNKLLRALFWFHIKYKRKCEMEFYINSLYSSVGRTTSFHLQGCGFKPRQRQKYFYFFILIFYI